MTKFIIATALVLCGHYALAKQLNLNQLLVEIEKKQGLDGKINHAREARFIAEKNQQTKKLEIAHAELAKQERARVQLNKTLTSNEKKLTTLQADLNKRSDILGELFGVARLAAGDLRAELKGSLTSAQLPKRIQKLSLIADNKELPTIEQLESLWFMLQQEMTASGNIVRFQSEILASSGELLPAEILQVGTFNAFSNGKYLRYLSATGKLAELTRQPEGKYLDLVEQFAATKTGYVDIALDPTRGAILNMLTQAPNKLERIQQGGIIGYIILILGTIGLLLVSERLFALATINKKMQKQLNDPNNGNNDNPLGRIIIAAKQNQSQDMDALELRLDEAIVCEIPKLEKGLPMIKLLAVVAPLLGLLGTVTGMIATFQSISLFGTGDPKLMAGGISQALVTTMLGLVVAIPLLFLHSLVSSRSKILTQILDQQSAGIISSSFEQNK